MSYGTASLGFRSAEGACRTIEGYESMHAIRKGQVRWVVKGAHFLERLSWPELRFKMKAEYLQEGHEEAEKWPRRREWVTVRGNYRAPEVYKPRETAI
jgi:hypothetical protein